MLDEENNAGRPQISHDSLCVRKSGFYFSERPQGPLLGSTHGQGLWDSLGGRSTIGTLCPHAHLLLE